LRDEVKVIEETMSEQMKNLGSKLPNGGRIGAALKFVAGAGILGAAIYNGVYTVEGGHRAVRVVFSLADPVLKI
jgi:hypothetical protein